MIARLKPSRDLPGEYVLDFQNQMAGVVAEESYLQEVRQAPRVVNDRLIKLFLEPSSALDFQLERITMESSRYNVGNIRRTINVPVMALAVLDPANRTGFRFGLADPKSAGAWTIAYKERQSRTLIRTNGDGNMPAHGRVRIEPDTGRVLMTEIVADEGGISATIDVDYKKHEKLGLLVPTEMREHYVVASDMSTIDGTAPYGNVRQFQVKVDEQMAPVQKKEK